MEHPQSPDPLARATERLNAATARMSETKALLMQAKQRLAFARLALEDATAPASALGSYPTPATAQLSTVRPHEAQQSARKVSHTLCRVAALAGPCGARVQRKR